MTQYPVDKLTDYERTWMRELPGRAQTVVLDVLGDETLNPGYATRSADLFTPGRKTRGVVRLRWAIWHRLRNLTDAAGAPWSYPRIARMFRLKDHTTVMHGVRRRAEQLGKAA